MENSLSRHLGYRPRYAPTDVRHVRQIGKTVTTGKRDLKCMSAFPVLIGVPHE